MCSLALPRGDMLWLLDRPIMKEVMSRFYHAVFVNFI